MHSIDTLNKKMHSPLDPKIGVSALYTLSGKELFVDKHRITCTKLKVEYSNGKEVVNPRLAKPKAGS